MSIEAADREAGAIAVAPRVSLESMERKITARYDLSGTDLTNAISVPTVAEIALFSLCILVMENGFILVGKSAPASPENYNAELGRKFAYEDCIRQLWPLEGYLLRDHLSRLGAQKA